MKNRKYQMAQISFGILMFAVAFLMVEINPSIQIKLSAIIISLFSIYAVYEA